MITKGREKKMAKNRGNSPLTNDEIARWLSRCVHCYQAGLSKPWFGAVADWRSRGEKDQLLHGRLIGKEANWEEEQEEQKQNQKQDEQEHEEKFDEMLLKEF